MEDIIKLRPGYGAVNCLKKMPKPDGSESKTYVLKTDMPTLGVGEVQGGNEFIDPSGGPMILEGSRLGEADAVVRFTDFVTGYGYTVTFL